MGSVGPFTFTHGNIRNACKILVGKYEGKGQRHMWVKKILVIHLTKITWSYGLAAVY
jgi:hypothetical protein